MGLDDLLLDCGRFGNENVPQVFHYTNFGTVQHWMNPK